MGIVVKGIAVLSLALSADTSRKYITGASVSGIAFEWGGLPALRARSGTHQLETICCGKRAEDFAEFRLNCERRTLALCLASSIHSCVRPTANACAGNLRLEQWYNRPPLTASPFPSWLSGWDRAPSRREQPTLFPGPPTFQAELCLWRGHEAQVRGPWHCRNIAPE